MEQFIIGQNFQQFMEQNFWMFIIVFVWSLVWKGIALWKSARNGDKWWYIAILILNTVGILEIVYIYFFGRKKEIKI